MYHLLYSFACFQNLNGLPFIPSCLTSLSWHSHCVKKCSYWELLWSVFFRIGTEYRILYTEYCIQSECGKVWTRITTNTGTFYVLSMISLSSFLELTHKHTCSGALRKRCSADIQKINGRTPMPKHDFNKSDFGMRVVL